MKRLASIILALMLFSGCSGEKTKRIGDIVELPNEMPISITAYSDDPSVGSANTEDAEMIKKIVELFKARSYTQTDTPAPGSNASFEFKYDSGKTIKLSVNALAGGDGKTYAPASIDDGLAALCEEIVKGK
ncbi:MAG: hypothetical protein IKZ82_09215 [Clostridia bacterium]|nr:hypothetical protein [Clostridia bacterium]